MGMGPKQYQLGTSRLEKLCGKEVSRHWAAVSWHLAGVSSALWVKTTQEVLLKGQSRFPALGCRLVAALGTQCPWHCKTVPCTTRAHLS